jgi:hypothetical protein
MLVRSQFIAEVTPLPSTKIADSATKMVTPASIPNRAVELLASRRVSLRGVGLFENVHKLAVATSYFSDGVFSRDFFG